MLTIPFVVYSHTDNLDCLEIATDYLTDFKNKILIINESDIDLEKWSAHYEQILLYKDNQQYGAKLYETLTNIKSDYILFSHEIDILLNKNIQVLNKLVDYAKLNQIDRINLQPSGHNGPEFTKVDLYLPINKWDVTTTPAIETLYISEQKGVTTYRYNVNPCIANVKSFTKMVENFKETSYRDMEDLPVQQYCENLKVCNLYKTSLEECGYFKCVSEYKFFHITHHRAFVRFDPHKPVTKFGQSYKDCSVEYQNIVSKYKLLEKSRNFA
jgi:hypothetical protein